MRKTTRFLAAIGQLFGTAACGAGAVAVYEYGTHVETVALLLLSAVVYAIAAVLPKIARYEEVTL